MFYASVMLKSRTTIEIVDTISESSVAGEIDVTVMLRLVYEIYFSVCTKLWNYHEITVEAEGY